MEKEEHISEKRTKEEILKEHKAKYATFLETQSELIGSYYKFLPTLATEELKELLNIPQEERNFGEFILSHDPILGILAKRGMIEGPVL